MNKLNRITIRAATIAVTGLILSVGQSVLANGFGNDNQGCAADRPCFTEANQIGNKITFRFDGISGWDFYNVRYAKENGEKQVENHSGAFTFTNVLPNRIYTLKVQGCHSHALARSTCSPWVEKSVTTK
jgi:hypothetical protein